MPIPRQQAGNVHRLSPWHAERLRKLRAAMSLRALYEKLGGSQPNIDAALADDLMTARAVAALEARIDRATPGLGRGRDPRGDQPMSRHGDWMQTFTGRQFWPLDPDPDEIELEDIAHALAFQCRFGGHCNAFYSVAQHSVLVSYESGDDAFAGLMHDAAEAYVADVIRPVKRSLGTAYADMEFAVWRAICARFALPEKLPASVKHADGVVLATEARDLMKAPPAPWIAMPPPREERIVPWSPGIAEATFRRRFVECR